MRMSFHSRGDLSSWRKRDGNPDGEEVRGLRHVIVQKERRIRRFVPLLSKNSFSVLFLLALGNLSYRSHAFQTFHHPIPNHQQHDELLRWQQRQINKNNVVFAPTILLRAQSSTSSSDDQEDDDEIPTVKADIVWPDEEEEDQDDDLSDWLPDRVKAQVKRSELRQPVEKVTREKVTSSDDPTTNNIKNRPSPYTEEEEEVIAAMGGKTQHKQRRREIGYLGDSTLREIATDYSVPVSYLADVLCMWGVMPPIQIDEIPLGDMVTGEQAFAILEAVNSLDVGALNDRYSNTSLRQLCFEYDIDLQDAFSMVMKEGWSLPFGVETCLRVEQEDELLRVLCHEGSPMTSPVLEQEEEKYMYGDPF